MQELGLKELKLYQNNMEDYPILAIDYGTKRIGIAISDSKGTVAQPLTTIKLSLKTKNEKASEIISEIIEEYRVKRILLGYPQAFIEKHKEVLKKIDKFEKILLEYVKIPVIKYDESYSTSNAKDMLLSTGQHFKGAKDKIDSVAAATFLEEFLNSNKQTCLKI